MLVKFCYFFVQLKIIITSKLDPIMRSSHFVHWGTTTKVSNLCSICLTDQTQIANSAYAHNFCIYFNTINDFNPNNYF